MQELVTRYFAPGLADDDEQRPLVPLRVLDADACRHRDRGMRKCDVLDFDRADPLTARLDHVLASVGDLHVAVGIDRRDVAGREPAHAVGIRQERIAALVVKIFADYPRTAHHQIAERLAVPRQLAAVRIDNLHVDAEYRPALLRLHLVECIATELRMLCPRCAQRAKRTQLRHPPSVHGGDVVALFEGAQHRRRQRSASHDRASHGGKLELVLVHVIEQTLPDGGNTGRHRHLLRLDQLVERLAIQCGARENQLRAAQRRAVGDLPGVDVEHRHHGKNRVARRKIHHIRPRDGKGVQQRRTVAVQHALGVAGRARRVAQRRGHLFVELRPDVLIILRGEQLLVALEAGDRACRWHVCAVGEHHERLHPR